MLVEIYLAYLTFDSKYSQKTNNTIKINYSPNSLILCSSFKEQTSSCPFFSATI